MIERVDGDVTARSNFLSQFILQIVGNALFLIGALTMVWIEDWQLGLTLTAFSGATIGLLIKLRHIAVPAFEAERKAGGRSVASLRSGSRASRTSERTVVTATR